MERIPGTFWSFGEFEYIVIVIYTILEKRYRLYKRLKIIEYKNKGQSEEIEDQGERQLDVINKQGKKQLEATKSKKSN